MFYRQFKTSGADTVAIAGTEHFGVNGIRKLIWGLEPWTSNWWCRPVSWTSHGPDSSCGQSPDYRAPRRETAVPGRQADPEARLRHLLRVGSPQASLLIFRPRIGDQG